MPTLIPTPHCFRLRQPSAPASRPFHFPTIPENWKRFSAKVSETLLESYASGAMDFRRMIAVMRSCALGCETSARLMRLGILAERALAITPAQARTRDYPPAFQRLAAGLVEFLREQRPDEKLEAVLAEAIEWLVAVGICELTARSPSARCTTGISNTNTPLAIMSFAGVLAIGASHLPPPNLIRAALPMTLTRVTASRCGGTLAARAVAEVSSARGCLLPLH